MDMDCSNCVYDDRDPNDDPCYKCLSGYYGKPGFCPKDSHKETDKEKEEKIFIDKNTPLPWQD